MNLKKYSLLSFLAAMFISPIMLFTSCESDPEPLALPPAESMIINLDQFPSSNDAVTKAIPSIGNWLYSSLTVLSWNTVLAVNMAIPVAAYAEAFNHTPPVYIGDNQWEWSYSTTIKQKTYVARLVGTRLDNETYAMEMFLSEGDTFTNFKWYEGVIRYDHTEVNWTISHSPDNPVEYLDIQFEKDFEEDRASIRYTVIDPENELFGSYIEYGKDTSLVYDSYYNIARNDTLTNIQWNTQTNAGRVMDERYFGDMVWHCWDSQLLDVECPQDGNNQLSEGD